MLLLIINNSVNNSINNLHQQFDVNVWAGTIGDLIGSVFLDERLIVLTFNFLNNQWTIGRSFIWCRMWFMHDALPYFSRITRWSFLNERFPNKWIDRAEPIVWSARSLDLNPLDFYFWDHLKTIVYSTPIVSVEILTISTTKLSTNPTNIWNFWKIEILWVTTLAYKPKMTISSIFWMVEWTGTLLKYKNDYNSQDRTYIY